MSSRSSRRALRCVYSFALFRFSRSERKIGSWMLLWIMFNPKVRVEITLSFDSFFFLKEATNRQSPEGGDRSHHAFTTLNPVG